jgi:hypothetical protein
VIGVQLYRKSKSQFRRLFRRKWYPGDGMLQGLTVQKLHRHESLVFGFAG